MDAVNVSRGNRRGFAGQISAGRMIGTLQAQVENLRAHIDTLKTHAEILKAQLVAAEARAEKQAAEFAAREARHTSDLNVERTLANQMSARVDQMMADLAAEQASRARAEQELADERSRRWWKPRTR